jgi:hypothetical protein
MMSYKIVASEVTMPFSYGIKTIRRLNQVPDADPALLSESAKLVPSDEEDLMRRINS